MSRLKALWARFSRSRAWTAWQHYGAHRGNILAGGVAYAALFSVFSALVVGFTVLGLVVGRDSALQQDVIAEVDAQLPGLLDVGADGGAVPPSALFRDDVLSTTGAIALVLALVSGLGWLDATREGIRAVFGLPTDGRSMVVKKVKDVGVMLTLGLAVVASAVLSVGVSSTAGALLELVGVDGGLLGRLLLRALGVGVVLVADTVILIVLFRLLSGLRLPWRDLRSGALFGACALGLLKLFGGLLLGSVGGSNPLLATAGVVVGLLVWMNLVSRVTLVSAAWAATYAGDHGSVDLTTGSESRTGVRPGGAVAAGARTAVAQGPRDVMAPSFGARAGDRTTVAAGAVLGAVAVLGSRVLVGAARTVRDAVRRSEDET